MKPFHYFLLLAAAAGWLAWHGAGHSPKLAVVAPVSAAARPADAPDPVSPEVRAAEQADADRENQARVASLAGMETKLRLRRQAAEKTGPARAILQRDKHDAWSALLATNWPKFLALREKARHSPGFQTACTICNGHGMLPFCVLCNHSDGNCVDCDGIGRVSDDEICPVCQGKGTCYMCGGSGRMSCPFCDDGMVSADGPLPPREMPVRCGAAGSQESITPDADMLGK